jgi:hypothetical protein
LNSESVSNEFPELGPGELTGLTELQVATVFRLAQHQLECHEELVKLEQRLVEQARQEVAEVGNVQARSAAIRRLEYLANCAERARARSRMEAVRLARRLISKMRAENMERALAGEGHIA